MSANQLSLSALREFAPSNSPLLAYRIEQTGNPMNDWVAHVSKYSQFRRELEENSVLGNVVVRSVSGDETPAVERVKILSLVYASKFFDHIEDAKEFVRCVKAIADQDAGQFEFEQIAAHYYRECRTRPVPEVLKEMAMLGMEMTRVTTSVNELEIEVIESDAPEIRLTPQEEKHIAEIQANLPPLPAPTPNFDAEIQAVRRRLSRSSITSTHRDEFEEFYLSDEGKTLEQLDDDFTRFDLHEQYDENGLLGVNMSSSSHTEVVLELDAEVTSDYLPEPCRPLAKQLQFIFVGGDIGGKQAQNARRFIACRKIEDGGNARARDAFRLNIAFVETPLPPAERFAESPLTRDEISEWMDYQLDRLYARETVRLARRFTTGKNGERIEFLLNQTVNPDFEEKQYANQILNILLEQMERDFHLSALRRNPIYQTIYWKIRTARDTAVLSVTAEDARQAKDAKQLTIKQYTALCTVAKIQFARLNDARPSTQLIELLREINRADLRKTRYLKWAMYGTNNSSHAIHGLPKQEVQKAWKQLRLREEFLKQTIITEAAKPQQLRLPISHRATAATTVQVKVTPI